MADTRRTLSALQTLLANNSTGDISAQDLRDMLVSVFPTGERLLATQTASSSSTLDFTSRNADYESGDLFQSDFDTYVFRFQQVLAGTNSDFQMQVSTNNGSTWFTTGYYYGWIYNSNSGTTGQVNGQNVAAWTLFTAIDTALDGVSGNLELYNPLNPKNSRLSTVYNVFAAQTSLVYRGEGFGTLTGATAVNAVRFKYSSGNIASGVIRCYGVAK